MSKTADYFKRKNNVTDLNGNALPFAPRFEVLAIGDTVRLLVRTRVHDRRFVPGQTYLVAFAEPSRWSSGGGGSYTVTITDAEGYRESFDSRCVARLPREGLV